MTGTEEMTVISRENNKYLTNEKNGYLGLFVLRVLRQLAYNKIGQKAAYNILQKMNTIETTFNKQRINQCTSRCILSVSRPQFTPNETICFQQCASMAKKQPTLQRLRDDCLQLDMLRPQS